MVVQVRTTLVDATRHSTTPSASLNTVAPREVAFAHRQLQDTERWIRFAFPFEEHWDSYKQCGALRLSEIRAVSVTSPWREGGREAEHRPTSVTSKRLSATSERHELEDPGCKNQNATFEIRRCLRTVLSRPANELENVASAPCE